MIHTLNGRLVVLEDNRIDIGNGHTSGPESDKYRTENDHAIEADFGADSSSVDILGVSGQKRAASSSIQKGSVAYNFEKELDGVVINSEVENQPTQRRVLHELEEDSSGYSSSIPFENEFDDFPEGGFEAWIVVLGSFFGLTIILGLINAIGAIQAYVEQNQLANLSPSKVSWVFSIYIFIGYLLSIQAGPLFDFYGCYYMCIAGTICQTASLMFTSVCTSYYQFILAFGILGGISNGLLMTPTIAIIGHWFRKKRGTALGAATIGGSFGGAVIPIMLRKLYTSIGYGWAIRTLGFLSLFCLTVSVILMKPRLPPRARDHSKSLIKALVVDAMDFSCLKDMRFMWSIVANILCEVSLLITLTFLTSYAIKEGYSQDFSYLLLTINNAVGVLGRYLPAVISDKIGRFNTMIAACTLCCISIWVIWLPFGHNKAALIIFAVIYGFSSGSILSLAPVCCGQICKTSEFGKRYGTMYFFISFGALVGVPIAGALILDDDYTWLLVFNGILATLGLLAWILSRYYCVGFSLRKV